MSKIQKEDFNLPPVDPHGENKIAESRGILEAFKKKITDEITKIRSDTDALENERRIREEQERDQRYDSIQTEVHHSYKENIGIDFKWQELEDKEDCEELSREIEMQKAHCQSIIQNKEKLIREFQEALKNKDDEYVKSLKKQGEDIDKLIALMRIQFNSMRDEYNTQLNEIEAAFRLEREEILQRNETEIEMLFKEHYETEERYLRLRTANEAYYADELEKLRSNEANDQQEHKIKLESELQTLQLCMEDMKAVYKLNEEKLEFNLRVLREREKHNENTKSQMSKKLNKMKERKRNLIADYNTESTSLRHKNIDLTNSYKRITLQFKELQKKFKRFRKSDERRFDEIWTMNQNEVFALVDKIIQADRVIHEQQLGIPWSPPTDPIFRNADIKGGGSQANQNVSVVESHGQSKADIGDAQSHATGGDKTEEGKVPIRKVKKVFNLLIDEMPYLIDSKVEQEWEGKSASYVFKAYVNALRKSLDIDNMKDIYMLVNTFFEFSRNKRREMAIGEEVEELETEAGGEDEELNIDGDEILNILRIFQKRREDDINNAEISGNPRNKKRSNFETEEQIKERVQKEENKFWIKITTILSERKLSVWKALEKALAKYYGLLVERKNLIDDTGLLNQQNEELKTLLNQYLQAGVNHELKVPPTQVIRLDM